MTRSTTKSDASAPAAASSDRLLELLGRMVVAREFEQTVQRLFTKGLVRGTTHLGQGQEAVSVGACACLDDGDTMTCTYRGHGAVLAMGAPIDKCFGEMMGREGGLCRGKGGSMHLTSVADGAMGSFAIVGAHLPITVGLAFAARYRRGPEVSMCFFGDGSTNIGAFHESLNLASLWKLPVIFICENNLYGEYSPLASTTPIDRLADRATSYGMVAERVDGNDIVAVMEVIGGAVERARAGEGPTLVEALTYRQVGHSRSDPATYRPEGELERWLERDPILLLRERLGDQGIDEGTLDAVASDAATAVAEALTVAESWPEPDVSTIGEDVYANA